MDLQRAIGGAEQGRREAEHAGPAQHVADDRVGLGSPSGFEVLAHRGAVNAARLGQHRLDPLARLRPRLRSRTAAAMARHSPSAANISSRPSWVTATISPILPRNRQFMPAIAPIMKNFSHISSRMFSLTGTLTGVPANSASIARVRSLVAGPSARLHGARPARCPTGG